jgi:acetyltransferase-like isoleucine patch superfamily enzyme
MSDPFQFNSQEYDKLQLASYGEDVFISAKSEIRRPSLVAIGSHVAIDSFFYCTTALNLGNYIHIGPHVSIIGGKQGLLKMGHFTSAAAGVRFICVSDTFTGEGLITAPGIPEEFGALKISPIIVEDFVNIGTNAVIMPGVHLKKGTVIGAGAVVTKDTEPFSINVGVPAKKVGDRPSGVMLQQAATLGYPFI